MMPSPSSCLVLTAQMFLLACLVSGADKAFPQVLPKEKPERPLSAAMARNYAQYPAPRPEDNELFSQFKYSQLQGLDYSRHDGTITRRDPSKVIRHSGKFYVWYTYRNTATAPRGPAHCSDTIPARDWDLCEIWYATSKDGFTWQEQGVAIPRPPKPKPGWRSVSTTDILEWQGKFYLYYQAFRVTPSTRGDDCPVAVSWADSPNGPWTPANKIVIPNGASDEWDGFSIHDPYPLVYKGKIYLYYKSDFDGNPRWVRMQGLAIAEHPLGPFKKHPLNPVINSGHETTLFPFKEGIAALVIRDGNEHFTIQYAPDGVNFDIAAITELMPAAAGPFVPDAFTNTPHGRGITWGLCHNTRAGGPGTAHSVLMRFDCDLSLDYEYPFMKSHAYSRKPEYFYAHGLGQKERARILKDNAQEQLE
jgi:hypothetical protein